MAIQNNTYTWQGFTISGSYHRITDFSWDKDRRYTRYTDAADGTVDYVNNCDVVVEIWPSKAYRDVGSGSITTERHHIVANVTGSTNETVLQHLYNQLKTNKEYPYSGSSHIMDV